MRFRPISMLAVGTLAFPALLPSQVQRDSAGIRIIENRDPRLPAARMWRVDPQPFLHIGGSETDSLYDFLGIVGVVRLPDGRIAVGNHGSSSIRFYNAQGRYLNSAGRRGRGPGEFQSISSLHLLGDTLVIGEARRAHLFSGTGQYLRTVQPEGRYPVMQPFGVLRDGSYIARMAAPSLPRPDGAARWVDSTPLVRVHLANGMHDTVRHVPHNVRTAHRAIPGSTMLVFGPTLRVAAADNRIYAGFPDRYEIGVYSPTGRLELLIRRAAPGRRVPATVVAEFKRQLDDVPDPDAGSGPPSAATRARRAPYHAEYVYADLFPAYSLLQPDQTGHLWVRHYDPWESSPLLWATTGAVATPPRAVAWDVFDPQGRWLGTVELPAGFTPTDIGNDYLAGVWRDADDLEYVRVYRLTKP